MQVVVLCMPEFLARTPLDYTRLAKRIVSMPAHMRDALHAKLKTQVEHSPLFDTSAWVRPEATSVCGLKLLLYAALSC